MPDFGKTLSRTTGIEPARTQPMHLGGTGSTGAHTPGRKQVHTPDGNGVALDQQLTKVADTETAQALTTTIYKKYMGLFSIALSKGA